MTESVELEKQKQALKEPSKYTVVILNDDFTEISFVVATLSQVFNISSDEASLITQDIHKKGKGMHGSYTKEIAETKAAMIVHIARENEYPLLASIEELE